MLGAKRERWQESCARAATEQDPEKLNALVQEQEIGQLLQEKAGSPYKLTTSRQVTTIKQRPCIQSARTLPLLGEGVVVRWKRVWRGKPFPYQKIGAFRVQYKTSERKPVPF
jgi:hypothetical protein